MKKSENVFCWKNSFRQARNAVYDIVFPPRCILCDELMEQGQGQLHPACKSKLFPVSGAVCLHCGRPVIGENYEFCYDCARKEKACHLPGKDTFFQGKSLFLYKGEIKQTMYRFKYSNKREYASYFAKRAVECYGDWLEKIDVDAVIPVPMYKRKERKRGYNQAAEFAKALIEAMELDRNVKEKKRNEKEEKKKRNEREEREEREKSGKIPVYDSGVLLRIKNTRPMKELNDVERKNNLRNAFQVTKNIVKYKKVLLVDDIYTTGSTADAVSHELLAAGVDEVYFLSICIGKGV
ncbi:MAG: ComF family protein [Agathobacter sp.]